MTDTTTVTVDRDEIYDAVRVELVDEPEGAQEATELTFELSCTHTAVVDLSDPGGLLLLTPTDLRALAEGLSWLADRATARAASDGSQ